MGHLLGPNMSAVLCCSEPGSYDKTKCTLVTKLDCGLSPVVTCYIGGLWYSNNNDQCIVDCGLSSVVRCYIGGLWCDGHL